LKAKVSCPKKFTKEVNLEYAIHLFFGKVSEKILWEGKEKQGPRKWGETSTLMNFHLHSKRY